MLPYTCDGIKDADTISSHVKISMISVTSGLSLKSVVLKFVEVSSKHLRVFLECLRKSSDIFGNFLKFSKNVRERSTGSSGHFWKILGNLRKVVENLRKIFGKSYASKTQFQYVYREFKQSATAGATTAAVTEKVWGEYVAAVCQILAK